ncbi:MAG: hypothetical protein ACFFDH_00225 [Promethearchaeota archaeon]
MKNQTASEKIKEWLKDNGYLLDDESLKKFKKELQAFARRSNNLSKRDIKRLRKLAKMTDYQISDQAQKLLKIIQDPEVDEIEQDWLDTQERLLNNYNSNFNCYSD